MTITLGPELTAAVAEQAERRGVSPEAMILATLNARFLPLEPRNEWERRLLSAGTACGSAIPNSALTAEGLYE